MTFMDDDKNGIFGKIMYTCIVLILLLLINFIILYCLILRLFFLEYYACNKM